ncbi:MAG: peptidoglycan-binding domain-containing protein [Parcubacteria group bacterium]
MYKLFPEYLNAGSSGPAVVLLQQLLLAMNYGFANELITDGVYGDQTMEAVKRLQIEIGVVTDGNFGPATREAFKAKKGISVDAIPAPMTYYVSPDGTGFHPAVPVPKDEVPAGTSR